MNRPYLSIVVTARNDDHGGNLLGRMQAFVNGLINQCKRHRVHCELVIVEWNPLPDRPPLAEALNWLDDEGFCEVRIIEVPPELHQRLRHWQAMPLYQMIGKNVGIRRARGEYVLATNIDVLFSDELMQFFAQRRLQPDKMYRVNRWDVMAHVPINAPVEEQLSYCEKHLIRLNAREGTIRLGPDGLRADDAYDIASGGSVRLGANWFGLERGPAESFRWVDNDAELFISPDAGETVLVLDIEPGPGVTLGALALELRDIHGNCLSEVRVKRRSVITFTLPDNIKGAIRVRLHARNGGRKIGSDLRTLNFRVFKCGLETSVSAKPAPVAKPRETVEAHVRASENFATKTGRRMKLLREIWRGNTNIQVRLPLSRKVLAKLQLRQDDDGLSFAPGALKKSVDEFLPRGLEAIWGPGWYPFEDHKGERFRWMQDHAVATWIPPRPSPGELLLHVEPGPAVGFKPCEVEIRDQWGELIATQQVKGRSTISIPVDQASGTLITSFKIKGGGKKQRVMGDSRALALRLFACSWSKHVRGEDLDEPELVNLAGGIWSGHRSCPVNDRNSSKGIVAMRDAELILRVPEGPNRHLILEIVPETGATPLDLMIEDPRGGLVFRGTISKETKVRLANVFKAENYYALRLRDGAHVDGPAPDEPMLSIPAIQWEPLADDIYASDAVHASETERIILHQPPPDHAIQLHTNACGDFTLLALERWMDLRAYPELDLFSMNIDSLFCWMAHHGGAREEMLEDPMRIYHIEHGTGSGWTPEGEKKLFSRIAAKGLSWVDYRDVVEMAKIMNRYDAPIIFNHDNWGFAGEKLKETVPKVRVAVERV